MSICSNCYHRIKHSNVIDVGHLWNNEPGLVVVCSDKCKDEIEKKVMMELGWSWGLFQKRKVMMVCQQHSQINSLEY